MGEDDAPPAVDPNIQWLDREIETAVLGLLLKDPCLYHDIVSVLEAPHFENPNNSHVFHEMTCQMKSSSRYDLVSLREAVAGRISKPDEVFADIERAANTEIPKDDLSDRVKHYAGMIRSRHYQRTLATKLHDIAEKMSRDSLSAEGGAAEAARESGRVLHVLEDNDGGHRVGDILRETFAQIQYARDRKSRLVGLSTGFHELDDMISGLQPGQLYVIGGRPSMGKTSLVCRILENVCLDQGQPAVFYSAEMSKELITKQMLCSHCRIDMNRLNTGMLGEEDFQKLLMGAGSMHDMPLIVNDTTLNIDRLAHNAREWKNQHGIKLIVADYLQKFEGSYKPNSSREQDVDYIARSFKNLAKRLEVPVVVTAQLNRMPDGRIDQRPRLSDLRESGGIEQEADVVLLLYRDEYYNPDTEMKSICEVNIAKNRLGPTDKVEMVFLKQYTRFENIAPRTAY